MRNFGFLIASGIKVNCFFAKICNIQKYALKSVPNCFLEQARRKCFRIKTKLALFYPCPKMNLDLAECVSSLI